MVIYVATPLRRKFTDGPASKALAKKANYAVGKPAESRRNRGHHYHLTDPSDSRGNCLSIFWVKTLWVPLGERVVTRRAVAN